MARTPKPTPAAHTPPAARWRARQRSESDAVDARVVPVLGACAVRVAADGGHDLAIRLLAGAQRGRVARWQLLASGLSDAAIKRRLRNGQLIREHDGVYALPLADAIPLGPDAAAVLAGGPGTCLSHHSGVVLWQLRPGRASPVHITVPYGRSGPAGDRRLIVHRSRILRGPDVVLHRGLPVTSPARTLLDVAAILPDRDIERLLDEALFVRRIVTRRAVEDVLRRAGGHPGGARLRRVTGRPGRRRTDSRPEERLLGLIAEAGLPAPQTQAHVLGYVLDLYWPELKLAVEVDTYGTHGSPRRFASDRRRDRRLQGERGIVVLRFTDGLIGERPLEAIASLAQAITRAVA